MLQDPPPAGAVHAGLGVGRQNDLGDLREVVIANEFAAVGVRVLHQGSGTRLVLRDVDSGMSVSLDPLDLVSFCFASPEEQRRWLLTDIYADGAERS